MKFRFSPASKTYFMKQKLKDTHREKSPSSKIPALTKNMNMDILVFIRVS